MESNDRYDTARFAAFVFALVLVAMITGVLGACTKAPDPKTVLVAQASPAPAAAARGVAPGAAATTAPTASPTMAPTAATPVVPAAGPSIATPGSQPAAASPNVGSTAVGRIGADAPIADPDGNPQPRGPLGPNDPPAGASTAPNTSQPSSIAPRAPGPQSTSTSPNR